MSRSDLRELRAAVPARWLVPSTARSLSYLALDLAVLAGLYALAWHAPLWLAPALWLAQGTMLWALFVLGHDCGHGSFSRHRRVNTLVGHLTHTPLLVPYFAWRASHRIHHRHVGDVERDETWHPLTAAQADALPWYVRLLRFHLPLVAFPFYLARRSPYRRGSHFRPSSPLFTARERRRVAASVALCGVFALALLAFALLAGPGALLRWYVGPYVVFVVWIDLVTYLHHTDPRVPWYRGDAWSFVDGALSTVDRRYGLLERVHHDAGCHVVHHLFPGLPHYRLRAAAARVRPLLGERYRADRRSIIRALVESLRACRVVPAAGDVVYYERGTRSTEAAPLGSVAASRPATR
ncbi:MAG: fatty acid desaturase [Thermodesulfobacteriota bacterium]